MAAVHASASADGGAGGRGAPRVWSGGGAGPGLLEGAHGSVGMRRHWGRHRGTLPGGI